MIRSFGVLLVLLLVACSECHRCGALAPEALCQAGDGSDSQGSTCSSVPGAVQSDRLAGGSGTADDTDAAQAQYAPTNGYDPAASLATAPSAMAVQTSQQQELLQQRDELQSDLQRLEALLGAARRAVLELSAAVQLQDDKLRALYGIEHPVQPGFGSAGGPSPSTPLTWLSHFHTISTVQTRACPTAVIAFNQPDVERVGWDPPRCVAVGDAGGTVYFTDSAGWLLLEYNTGTVSPITAMASYSIRRNESVLVTGHQDGEVRTHGVYEVYNGTVRRTAISSVYLNHVLLPGLGPTNATTGLRVEQPPAPITHLLPHRALGKQTGRRQLAVWDSNGWLRVQRDDGSVKYAAHSAGPQLAASQNGDLLVGLSASAATVLRTSLTGVPRTIECVGLNGSTILSATFDLTRQYRAFAWTDTGDLLSLVVPHATRASVCKVAKRFSVGGTPSSMPPAVRMAALRGHLTMLRDRPPTFHTFNTTSVVRDGMVEETAASVAEVAEALGLGLGSTPHDADLVSKSGDSWDLMETQALLMTVGRSDVIAVSLGDNWVALLRSTLPVPAGMDGQGQKRGWTQLVFIGLMCVVAVFQFSKARNHSRGGYGGASSVRLQQALDEADFMAGAVGSRGGLGGARGGPRESAAARLAMYQATLQDIDRQRKDAFPSRAMRRAARMAPVSTRLHDMPDAIVEDEEEEENSADGDDR